MELCNKESLSLEIKLEEETEPHIELEEAFNIKAENDAVTGEPGYQLQEETSVTQEPEMVLSTDNDHPFGNIQLTVKHEANPHLENCAKLDFRTGNSESSKSIITNESNIENEINLSIKEERSDDNLVTYDYPSFDDTGSADSNDATALGVVEACLQDEIDIKSENDENFQGPAQKEEFHNTDFKMETDVTVTETELTSQQITPDITSSAPKYTFVMKIAGNVVSNIDQIITKCIVNGTSYHKNENLGNSSLSDNKETKLDPAKQDSITGSYQPDENEAFQLNSITGNVLSLEQEAYGIYKSSAACEVHDMAKIYACPKCPKIYGKKGSLKGHLNVHKTIENYANGRKRGLQTRKKNNEKKLKKSEPSADDSDEAAVNHDGSNYACTCGKVYHRRSRMETCLRTHDFSESTHKYVTCMTCLKQFKNKQELSLHRKRLHRKKFPCKFCPTDYDTRKELFKHLQIHQKVQLMEYKVIEEVVRKRKKIRCFMCSKTWAELSELKNHVMNQHNGPYSCPHCKNTFPKIIDFGNHIRTYHPEVEGQSVLDVLQAFSRLVQEWKCEECDLQFLEADKLALHQIEKHSPELKTETQFQCPDCRRVFISQKGLTSHRRIHHSVETTVETKPEEMGIMCLECRTICKDITALTSHMRFHSPDRKYPCKFCDFRFATQEKRKAHIEIHTGDMRFVCFICEYQCSSENRLKQHKMSLKHANMKEYLLTGKPLLEESTSNDKVKEKKEGSSKKRKKMERDSKSEKDSRDFSSSDKEEFPCDICGDKFPSENEMLDHKQIHPFIEFPNDDKPSRIFFK